MKPRGDYLCIACNELYELPLGATICPDNACGGLLERRFTAPMIGSDHAKRVDAIAEPVLAGAPAGQRAPAPAVPKEAQTRIMAPAAALGMVGGDNRMASRGLNAPLINALRGKGPLPNYRV